MASTTAGDDRQLLAAAVLFARLGWGCVQVLAAERLDGLLSRGTGPSSAVGWRMKGLRDVAIAAAALAVPGYAHLRRATLAGAVFDAGDALACIADGGRSLRPAAAVAGALGGAVSAVGALVLARELPEGLSAASA